MLAEWSDDWVAVSPDGVAVLSVPYRALARPARVALWGKHRLLASVLCIQSAYKRYCDLCVYKHFREVLRFRNAGDPIVMLRAVNPKEAALVDPASGLRLRFRLGGASFPPAIYYKLFTNAPVCDLNAFAPRDYTDPSEKLPSRAFLHSKDAAPMLASIAVGTSSFAARISGRAAADLTAPDGSYAPPPSWYRRKDLNGWRLVTVPLSADGTVEAEVTSKKALPHHISRVRRRVDQALQRKLQKRRWMMTMYREGLAKEAEDARAPVDFEREDWEEELPTLLEWSDTLDFDAYMSEWAMLGTSATSFGTPFVDAD